MPKRIPDPTPVYRVGRGFPQYNPGLDPEIGMLPPRVSAPILSPTRRDLDIGEHANQYVESMRKGGLVKRTGIYKLHAGEKVVPAPARKTKPAAARKAAPTRRK
jgi:hypothetical protein